MTQIVTINTDASYHPIYKVGAYAFWIVFQGNRITHSGPLKSVKDSLNAEIMAIGNALYALLKSDHVGVKYIIINTDCTYAIAAIRDKKKNSFKGSEEAVKKCHKIIDDLKKKYNPGPRKYRTKPFISWRHVKAHSRGETARLWVNNWLDNAAKIAMRSQIGNKTQP